MLKRRLAVVVPLAVALTVLVAQQSGAKPCSSFLEAFQLTPRNVVTWNGRVIERGDAGVYETDAGFTFDVEASRVAVVPFDAFSVSTTCGAPASEVELTVINPFTGLTETMRLVKP